MDAQNIIAGIIVIGALAYVASVVVKKVKAFKPRTAKCADDCGCGTER